jgi:3-demethoxyubiquinol 3-hydroxylase
MRSYTSILSQVSSLIQHQHTNIHKVGCSLNKNFIASYSYVSGGSIETEKRKVIDEMLRVDQAGEAAAVQIYAGQMWVLKDNKRAHEALNRMKEGEVKHLDTVERLMSTRRSRPSLLLPVWRAAGFALGAATALLGKDAAMACTVAVETVISEHYNSQIREMLKRGLTTENEVSSTATTIATIPGETVSTFEDKSSSDAALLRMMSKHRDEELEHHADALKMGAENAPFYNTLTGGIKAGCAAAIVVAKRV